MDRRLIIALSVAIAGFLFEFYYLTNIAPYVVAFDFTWAWRAGQAILSGQNPYSVIRPTGDFPFDSGFKYPLPVALVGVPVAHLPPRIAAAIFSGAGIGLFAFALTRDGYWRLPLLLSAPSIVTLELAQWTFLLAAAALVPALGWVACCKPTTGLASFAYRPTRLALLGGALVYAACLAINPSWPIEWIRASLNDPATHWYIPAVAIRLGPYLVGPILLLAALRWRSREGRLLLVLALVPQVQSFHTGLLALLAARTRREVLWLVLISCLGYAGWLFLNWHVPESRLQDPAPNHAPWLFVSVYLPALAVVLRHPSGNIEQTPSGELTLNALRGESGLRSGTA